MEHGYDLDPSVLDECIVVLCGTETENPPCLQIHVRNEKDLFMLIESLLHLYKERMENK